MTQKKTNIIAIVTMWCLFAMISFVTNMAAPFGNIWVTKYSWAGMLGNMMNFGAYLFMGIPAGKMLMKLGYKKTTLIALAVGFTGILVQWISSKVGGAGYAPFIVYLLGAFICGFCVCMLNTVVNPMLTLLGGGGNRSNQLIQVGGTLNSLAGASTPLLVGVLIGTVTKHTSMSDVAPLLFIAMGVFAAAFAIISFLSIPNPNDKENGEKAKFEHHAWNFRHFCFGAFAIFCYVGAEVGIPAQLNFFFSDASEKGANILVNGALIGGAFAACYWLIMMVGRMLSVAVSGKLSPKAQLSTVCSVAIVLVIASIFIPKTVGVPAPKIVYNPVEKTKGLLENISPFAVDSTGTAVITPEFIEAFIAEPSAEALEPYSDVIANELEMTPADLVNSLDTPIVPLSTILLILVGLCMAPMWGAIFNMSVEGLGKYTEEASGVFMTMVVGGGIMNLIQNWMAQHWGYMNSYWLVILMVGYILFFSLWGSRNVNKDIPTE